MKKPQSNSFFNFFGRAPSKHSKATISMTDFSYSHADYMHFTYG